MRAARLIFLIPLCACAGLGNAPAPPAAAPYPAAMAAAPAVQPPLSFEDLVPQSARRATPPAAPKTFSFDDAFPPDGQTPPAPTASAPLPTEPPIFTRDTIDDAMAADRRGDYAAELRMLGPLADQGNVDAQFFLGGLYDEGHGVAQDFAEAGDTAN